MIARVLQVMTALAMLAVPVSAAAPAPAAGYVVEDYMRGAWLFYKSQFVHDGRIVDDANGGVSHSEGQGYGMLLAVAADDQATFTDIWDWTQDNLIRPRNHDKLGLAAWKWDPAATPHVADMNNATDGDLVIAWALLRAYKRWGDVDYFDDARVIAAAIATDAVESNGTNTILLPGASGFDGDDIADGPVVNLSYWVFPAIADLAVFKDIFPSRALLTTGLSLLKASQFGPAKLPADWISLAGDTPAPAAKYPQTFGYDAIRIPLYLAWMQSDDEHRLDPYLQLWTGRQPQVGVIDLATGKQSAPMDDGGYRAIADLVQCSANLHPAELPGQNFTLTHYYPSTLDMLSLLAMVERYPQCLAAS